MHVMRSERRKLRINHHGQQNRKTELTQYFDADELREMYIGRN